MPTFTVRWVEPSQRQGSPIRMPRRSRIFSTLQADRSCAARGRISSRLPPPHPDARCHKFVTAHGSVAKDSGKALELSLQRGVTPRCLGTVYSGASSRSMSREGSVSDSVEWGHSLAWEWGRFRKRRYGPSLPLLWKLMWPGGPQVHAGRRHRARNTRHEVVQ